jgi:hypothetical protein
MCKVFIQMVKNNMPMEAVATFEDIRIIKFGEVLCFASFQLAVPV